MTRAVVFLGPSLDLKQARSLLDATWLPPAEIGSVYLAVRDLRPDIVLMIDGRFDDVLAPWHREILWAMSEGVHLFGAASMGALRAAELAAFGMHGIGKVFEAYCAGIYPPFRDFGFEDDDEVAVIQGPDFAGYRPLSDAMVDIREALARAAEAGVITPTGRDMGVAFAKGLHYPDRTMQVVIDAVAERDREEGRRLTDWWATNAFSQKAEDACQALRQVGRFIETYPGPHRAQFTFERSLVWERLRTKLDQRETSQGPGVAAPRLAS